MQVARRRADALLEEGEEGDDVVAGDLLDLVDPLGVPGGGHGRLPLAFEDRFARHETRLRHRIRRRQFDAQPALVAVFGRPEPGHLGAAVAGDHGLRVPAGGWSRNLVWWKP